MAARMGPKADAGTDDPGVLKRRAADCGYRQAGTRKPGNFFPAARVKQKSDTGRQNP